MPRGRVSRRAARDAEASEVQRLEEAIAASAPAPGTNPLESSAKGADVRAAAAARNEYPPMSSARNFDQLPLSGATQEGLRGCKYKAMTAIQRSAIPHALAGRDLLGAAKTGSGKTLAFLVPLVEKLFRQRWSPEDGVGAIVITPTRELAMQIFDTLRKFARMHSMSAALLIGGKDVEYEKEKVSQMNILVATPGRLLQHMDETPLFDCDNLQMLVLDEADRILDLGFAATLDSILANLPRNRQTLLFSATQTRRVSDLARLSLRDPEYCAVHEHSASATPPRLVQMVSTVPLPQKMHALWAFIKLHLHHKTLVFATCCRQVAFLHEALRQLRPGVPLRCLHGRMKQPRRMMAYTEFCEATAMVLLATDVAARGLDFPAVDWVLQLDCPEDSATYIHRVGRTARYTAAGKALLLLDPSEGAMIDSLAAAKVTLRRTSINLERIPPVTPALEGLLTADPGLKEQAQRCVVAFLRAVHVMSDKAVFDVKRLDAVGYAYSLGLTTAPRLRFIQRERKGQQHLSVTAGGEPDDDGDDDDDDDEGGAGDEEEPLQDDRAGDAEEDDDDDDDILRPVASGGRFASMHEDANGEDDATLLGRMGMSAALSAPPAPPQLPESQAKPRKVKLRIKAATGTASRSRGTKVVFDAHGTPRAPLEALALERSPHDDGKQESGHALDYRAAVAARFSQAAALRASADAEDKRRERELRRQKKLDKKRKLKARREGMHGGGVTLGGGFSDGDDDSGSDGGDAEDDVPQAVAAEVVKRKRTVEPAHEGMRAAGPRKSAPQSLADLEGAALARLTRGAA